MLRIQNLRLLLNTVSIFFTFFKIVFNFITIQIKKLPLYIRVLFSGEKLNAVHLLQIENL